MLGTKIVFKFVCTTQRGARHGPVFYFSFCYQFDIPVFQTSAVCQMVFVCLLYRRPQVFKQCLTLNQFQILTLCPIGLYVPQTLRVMLSIDCPSVCLPVDSSECVFGGIRWTGWLVTHVTLRVYLRHLDPKGYVIGGLPVRPPAR